MDGARDTLPPLGFLFQAGDGIRDTSVTGVQTCALPISVAGLTTEQAAAAIREALAPTHRVLSVTVTVKEHRSKVVSVLGEVQTTSQVPLRGRTTLLDRKSVV